MADGIRDELNGKRDTLLLRAILAEDIGTIANIVQAASELEGTMSERLSAGYYELTNKDPRAETDTIGLKDEEDDNG